MKEQVEGEDSRKRGQRTEGNERKYSEKRGKERKRPQIGLDSRE